MKPFSMKYIPIIFLLMRINIFSQKYVCEIVGVNPNPAFNGSIVSVTLTANFRLDRDFQIFFGDYRAEIHYEDQVIKQSDKRDIRVAHKINAMVPLAMRIGSNQLIRAEYRNQEVARYSFFTVLPPNIVKINPDTAHIGSLITIVASPPINIAPDRIGISFNGLIRKPERAVSGYYFVRVPEGLSGEKNPVVSMVIDQISSEPYYKFYIREPETIWSGVYVYAAIAVILLSGLVWYIFHYRSRKKKMGAVRSSAASEKTDAAEEQPLNLPEPEPPNELIEAIAAGDCILFAGAGLSARANFPTWKPFIEGLLNWAAEKKFLDRYYSESFKSAITTNELGSVADGIISSVKSKEGEKDLLNYLTGIFVNPRVKIPNTHRLLCDINFAGILTTNFDNLIEQIYPQHIDRIYISEDVQSLLNAYTNKEFFIFKQYGSLDRLNSVIISPAEYRDAISNNRALSQFLENIFYSKTIFFIGTSLQGIEDFLSGMNITTSSGTRRHYALVAVSGSAWQSKADILSRRFSIEIIPFQISETYPEVDSFLEKIIEKIVGTSVKTKMMPPESSLKNITFTSKLKGIKLENIGPFDSFELDLNTQWNILLGDNGVGKSTILKAIAVGICGKDAELYAHRLIKTGKMKARIIIETDRGKEYITEIFNLNGRAEITTKPSRLIESEGWLCLGFPPLRNFTWDRPKTVQSVEGVKRPVSDDLLPLIKNEPDPRLDKLKQWIVNLDYRIKDDKVNNRWNSPYELLLKEFFKFVDDLTKGVKVEFKGVNPETKEVTIITDDGEVPLEVISQGTTSLIGWIGVTLQRFYEVYGQTDRPRERFGLILIDEIDAHMHPAWQQEIVGKLRILFPGVQFIATTHSPLIPIGSKPYEVQRLRRDPDSADKIVVDKVDFDLRRWRADQVLTSPLFDLESTVAPEINKALEKYTELSVKEKLSNKEEKELEKCSQLLKIKPPSPQEKEEARKAFELIKNSVDAKLMEIPEDKRKKMLDEVKAQIQETIGLNKRLE